IVLNEDRDLARAPHICGLVRAPIREEPDLPLILARVVQHPPHWPRMGNSGFGRSREPAIARLSHCPGGAVQKGSDVNGVGLGLRFQHWISLRFRAPPPRWISDIDDHV